MKEIERMTDSEIIEALSKDWIERDGESFVRIRKTGRLGWEKTLEKGTPYSSYLLGTPTMEELIRKAYPLAKQTISAMDVPFKVDVKISESCSCTESKNVYVATKYFDDEALPTGKKLDIFLGLTAHEGSHLLYTDFPQMGKAQRVHPLCANLLNIIEDERIERLLGEEKPGLANYIGAVKEHYFGAYSKDNETKPTEELSKMSRIINAILGLVRYPRLLKREDMIEFGKVLLKTEEILTPYPASTAEAETAAEKIFALIKDEYMEDGKKKSSSKDNCEKKESSKGDASSDGTGENESSKGGRRSSSKGESGKGSPAADFDKDYSELSKELSKVASGPVQPGMEGCSSLSEEDTSSEVEKEGGLLASLCEGSADIGSTHDVIFRRAPENQDSYMRALAEVRRFVPAISKAIKGHSKDYAYTHMGMRSGLLDASKLAEAVQGVPTVYVRKGEVKSDRATVCILVDESGSMIREGRMTAAKQTAVLLNEALSGIPNIELFMYGHSADEESAGRTDLRIYREKGFAPRYSLGTLEARDNNRDGVAILETAMRVRKQTDEKEVLMFIISDGAPAAQGYIGREAIAHTRMCVEKAEKMGFRIVQICINASYDPSLMFRHYMKLEDLSTLAHDLSKVIAKTLSEKIGTHVI